jgi:hypothetical protein
MPKASMMRNNLGPNFRFRSNIPQPIQGYLFASVIMALCLPFPLRAQSKEDDGQIRGVVSDPSGALIPKVHIELLKSGKRIQSVESNGDGSFTISNVPAGRYSIVATATNFDKFKGENIKVSPHEVMAVAIVFKIAPVAQDVIVRGEDNASGNGFGSVLNRDRVDGLPDDPNQLQAVLNSLAAQSGGSGTPQIYVDGFSVTEMPPKDLIQEIRVNQDPYSAKYSDAGGPRIEIVTKSGSGKLQGSAQIDATSSALNTKNHLVESEPRYYSLLPAATLSGSINKWASCFAAGSYSEIERNAIINADVLSAQFTPIALEEAVPAPSTTKNIETRIHLHSVNSDTVDLTYGLSQTDTPNGSVGGLSLSSQGLKTSSTMNISQLSNKEILGKNSVNLLDLRYAGTSSQQEPIEAGPTITVEGAFVGGGSNAGTSRNENRSLAINEDLTLGRKNHVIDLGGQFTGTSTSNASTSGFNGNFTFSSLGAYQITEEGLANQLPFQEIQAKGGGASQFSITTGDPKISESVADFAGFLQDEWKLRPGLQADFGLRYDRESGKYGRGDLLPRLGFNYEIKHRKAAIGQTLVTGGLEWSVKHFGLSNIEQLERFNGITQQQYLLNLPDFFPTFPSVSTLNPGPQSPLTTYNISSRYRDSYTVTGSAGISQPILKATSVYVNYRAVRSLDQLITRNINTPLPGTYDPSNPSSGTRPFGNDVNILQFDPDGSTNGSNLIFGLNVNAGTKFSLSTYWLFDSTKSDTGPGTPSNPYNLEADYGRIGPRNRAGAVGQILLPFLVSTSLYVDGSSSQPFNIVVGQDLNGDGLFNDRPSFATDLSRPSVVSTKWGVFDTSPIPGQTIIPINYGSGPPMFTVHLQLKRSFEVGPMAKKKPGGGSQDSSPNGGGQGATGLFRVDMSASAQNVFNIDSLGPPDGTLGSPLFGKSISGGNGRTVYLHTGISF